MSSAMSMLAKVQSWIIGIVLGVVTTTALAVGHRDVGYVRDEGIYFEASRSYGAWLAMVAKDPGKVTNGKLRDRYLGVNHEHPALMKMAGGLSAAVLAQPPHRGESTGDDDAGGSHPMLPEGAAMRLPAQILAGLGVTMLYIAGVALGGSAWAGLLAAGWFILLPRVWFHAGLHAFDVPVAVAGLAVVLAYRRALSSRGWGLALGPILGVAIVIKHNALFLGPLLAIHFWCTLAWARWRDQRPIAGAQWIGLPLWSMAIGAPATALALWPWLWSDPLARVTEYFAFHRQHNYYNMEFLGENFNQPPMPTSYPFVMTWATVPTVLLLLAVLGLIVLVHRDLVRARPSDSGPRPQRVEGSFFRPIPRAFASLDGLLITILALFPLVLIALPSTPIFGGTKHWITAYPFLALAAAVAWGFVWQHSGVGRLRQRWLAPIVVAIVLGPGAMATLRGHPYNLSQYAPLVGGARGAADLGLARGFWGHSVRELLPALEGRSVFVHDLHELARKQYAREGLWPPGAESTSISRADAGLLFYERHMATYEFELWERIGSTAPAQVISLHDVPQTSLYAR